VPTRIYRAISATGNNGRLALVNAVIVLTSPSPLRSALATLSRKGGEYSQRHALRPRSSLIAVAVAAPVLLASRRSGLHGIEGLGRTRDHPRAAARFAVRIIDARLRRTA
jgi:hypothetical protein